MSVSKITMDHKILITAIVQDNGSSSCEGQDLVARIHSGRTKKQLPQQDSNISTEEL